MSLHKRRSINNLQILQKIQNNSLIYFKNYQKSLIQQSQNFVSKSAPNPSKSDQKLQNMFISINDFTLDWQKIQISPIKKIYKKDSSSQNKFYQIFMEQSTLLTYSKFSQNSTENKQNNINSSNCSNFTFSGKSVDQKVNRVENMEKILNQKLMNCYSKVIKKINKYNALERQNNLKGSSLGMRKIDLIDKLINILQTNKNLKIRQMFQDRQKLCQHRDSQKKQCQKKLEKIKQIEIKYKNRRIDQFSAIHELNGIRG